jgi:ubiquinone/menaquinone biosynthesis C-methylase UbiE
MSASTDRQGDLAVHNKDIIEPSSRHSAVQKFFGQNRKAWLERYNSKSFDARNYRRRADVALNFLAEIPKKSGRLLEIGCGAGVQAAAAHRLGWKVSAVDITVPLLAQAREQFTGPHWVAATAEDIPFPPGTFDVVLMLGVIGYVSNPEVVLKRVREVLAPGGHLIISWARKQTLMESAGHVVSAVPDRVYMTLKRMFTQRNGGDENSTNGESDQSFYTSYNRFWDRPEFAQLLANTGFVARRMRGVNFGQFRFMDRVIWPERVDAMLSSALEGIAEIPGCRRLGYYTRTHVALAQCANTDTLNDRANGTGNA